MALFIIINGVFEMNDYGNLREVSGERAQPSKLIHV